MYTEEKERAREEDVEKQDDERKRGGRHLHGDEKGDTRHETDRWRQRGGNVILTTG